MKLFSESLLVDLEHQLKLILSSSNNPLCYSKQAIKAINLSLSKLKQEASNYKFDNKADEIQFFKESKPKFTSQLIYYNEIYNIEINKPFGTSKTIRKYYNNQLVKLQSFFVENKEFYRYIRTGNKSLDNKYFIRGNYNIKYSIDSSYFLSDHSFSTSHDDKLAKMLANDRIKIYLENKILILKLKENNNIALPKYKTLKWTASKVALIELVYALHTEGVFNNGTSDLKEIALFFESVCNVDLGQFNRVFIEIRNRKSDRAKFLNTLMEKLIHRMDYADEK